VTSSVGDGEPLPGVSVVLDLVDQCDGVVLDAELANFLLKSDPETHPNPPSGLR
jgi:hypothetical protein